MIIICRYTLSANLINLARSREAMDSRLIFVWIYRHGTANVRQYRGYDQDCAGLNKVSVTNCPHVLLVKWQEVMLGLFQSVEY